MKIQLIRKDNVDPRDFYPFTILPGKESYKLALTIISYMGNREALFRQVMKRKGIADSNARLGFTYERNLDEYDKIVDPIYIPKDCIMVYNEYASLEYYLTEEEFLEILIAYYDAMGYLVWSSQLKAQMKIWFGD